MLSTAESSFLQGAAELGIREDGRGLLDTRDIKVLSNVIAAADGSSIISREFYPDRVSCGVKYEVVTRQNKFFAATGAFDFSLDISKFREGNKFSRNSLDSKKRSIEYMFNEILNRALEKVLCIEENEIYLNIFVDCVVESLSFNGNLIDLISSAIYVALLSASRVKLKKVTESSEDHVDFIVDEDFIPLIPYDMKDSLFVSSTLFEIGKSIFCIDASPEEEACCLTSGTFFLNRKLEVIGIYMGHGDGGFLVPKIKKVLSTAKKCSKKQLEFLESSISQS